MDIKELDAIRKIILKGHHSCLCGHGESCPSCSGETDSELSEICKNIDLWFSEKHKILIIYWDSYGYRYPCEKYICRFNNNSMCVLETDKNGNFLPAKPYSIPHVLSYARLPKYLQPIINDTNIASFMKSSIIRESK